LRNNLGAQEPEKLWQFYIQLTQVEASFKDLKDDLALRPIYHQLEKRIDAHRRVLPSSFSIPERIHNKHNGSNLQIMPKWD